jgi:predicted RNase H-like HicB family nuclease
MGRKVYAAKAVRIGDWWAVTVEGVRGVHTQARRLDQVEEMARDALALMLDIDPQAFDVIVRPQLTSVEQGVLAQLAVAQKQLRDAQTAAAEGMAAAAAELVHGQGLTLRDAGSILGVSYQRVGQLMKRSPSGAGSPKTSPKKTATATQWRRHRVASGSIAAKKAAR